MSLEALLPSTPIGALVAKLGGSDAEWVAPPSDRCRGAVADGFKALRRRILLHHRNKGGRRRAVVLTMNDRISGFVDHADQLDVTVAVAV